ncbi:MAG: SprT family zinc-dependent metalloprotease [Patescibacteria group bacterium]
MSIEPSKIIYSKRKTLCLQITREGEFIVRAPRRASKSFIYNFIAKKQDWIVKTLAKIIKRVQNSPKLTFSEEQIKEYKKTARALLQDRLSHWSIIMKLNYTSFRLSSAKTRWGSCSCKDVISLNWRLVLIDMNIIDYVVIHELAHVRQKNHSAKFWIIVEKYCPNYKDLRRELKEKQLLSQV